MSQFLAIDVDVGGLYVATGTAHKGSVAITRAVALPDDAGPLTAETAAACGKKLKDLLKQSGVAAAPAIVLLGRDKVLLKDVRHPTVPGSEEPAVVRFQAVKELNDSPDDFVLDYLPVGPTPDGGRKSQAAFIKKDLLAAIKTMCETAGLKLAAVTPRPFAAAAGLRAAFAAGTETPDAPTDAVALIYPTAAAAEFAVVRGDELLFTRPIPANALLSEQAFVGDVRRNLAVVNGQVPGGVTALYLAEADAPGGWAGRLQEALPLPVRPYDPLTGSPAADVVPPQYRGAFAAVVGAIRLRSLPGPLPINFVTPRQPKAEPNKNRTKFLAAALAACLLLGAGFLGGMWLVEQKGKELADLEADKTRIDDELFQMMANAKRSEASEEFLRYQVRLHDELYDWTDHFPDITKSRVTSIDFNTTALPSKTERQKEEKAKEANPSYKPPVKPVGTATFTVQTSDRTAVDTFVKNLAAQRHYVGVTSKGGAIAGGAATTAGNQTFTVNAGIHARKPDQYTRKLNVTLPKPKPKAADFDDDLGGGGGFPGFNALPGGATP